MAMGCWPLRSERFLGESMGDIREKGLGPELHGDAGGDDHLGVPESKKLAAGQLWMGLTARAHDNSATFVAAASFNPHQSSATATIERLDTRFQSGWNCNRPFFSAPIPRNRCDKVGCPVCARLRIDRLENGN